MSEPTQAQLTAGLLRLQQALDGRWRRIELVRAIWLAMREVS